MRQGPSPSVLGDLPPGITASTTVVTPASRHRWASDVGLVETTDGSLLLHGIARIPGEAPAELTITVFVDYEPVAATIRVWSGTRDTRIAAVSRQHEARATLDTPAAAFDIELPQRTVAIGRWREVQTVVQLGSAEPDVRRWTLYAGPEPPAPTACVVGTPGAPATKGRLALRDGRLTLRAPQPGEVGIIAGAGTPAVFVRFDEPGAGWSTEVGAIHSVWGWSSPMMGPRKDWISAFWSAALQTEAAVVPEVR